jgi:hypothetical protein
VVNGINIHRSYRSPHVTHGGRPPPPYYRSVVNKPPPARLTLTSAEKSSRNACLGNCGVRMYNLTAGTEDSKLMGVGLASGISPVEILPNGP